MTGQLFHAAEAVPLGMGTGVIVRVGTGVIGDTIRGLDVALGSGVVTGISKKLDVGDAGIGCGVGVPSTVLEHSLQDGNHLGLKGMLRRLEAVSGRLMLANGEDGGLIMRASVPTRARQGER